jgi:hypothetical protein
VIQADHCLPSIEVSREFCGQLLAMSRLIAFLVESAQLAQSSGRTTLDLAPGVQIASEQVVACGVQWFYVLAELDSPVTRLYPPARFFLRQSLASLRVVLASPLMLTATQQTRLLGTLAEHAHLIPVLAPALNPGALAANTAGSAPEQFVQLLRQAITVNDVVGRQSAHVLARYESDTFFRLSPLTIALVLYSAQVRHAAVAAQLASAGAASRPVCHLRERPAHGRFVSQFAPFLFLRLECLPQRL